MKSFLTVPLDVPGVLSGVTAGSNSTRFGSCTAKGSRCFELRPHHAAQGKLEVPNGKLVGNAESVDLAATDDSSGR